MKSYRPMPCWLAQQRMTLNGHFTVCKYCITCCLCGGWASFFKNLGYTALAKLQKQQNTGYWMSSICNCYQTNLLAFAVLQGSCLTLLIISQLWSSSFSIYYTVHGIRVVVPCRLIAHCDWPQHELFAMFRLLTNWLICCTVVLQQQCDSAT